MCFISFWSPKEDKMLNQEMKRLEVIDSFLNAIISFVHKVHIKLETSGRNVSTVSNRKKYSKHLDTIIYNYNIHYQEQSWKSSEGHCQRTSCVRVDYQNFGAWRRLIQVIWTEERLVLICKDTGKQFDPF